MRWLSFFIAILLCEVSLVAQQTKSIRLSFIPFFSSASENVLDTTFHFNTSDSIHFETLKFYVSAIELYSHSKKIWTAKNSFHLVDAAQEKSKSITLDIPKDIVFDTLHFNLGIDSSTNTAGVMGGDLDPTKGMYWTWQSGYINVKLEGTTNLAPSPNHAFEFHLGGYMAPFETVQSIDLASVKQNEIKVYIDLKQLVTSIDFQQTHHVMSPNANAVKLSHLFTHCFSVR